MAKKTGGKGKQAAPSTASTKPAAPKAKKPGAAKPSAPAKPAPTKKSTTQKTPAPKASKANPAVTTKTKGKEAKPRPAPKSAKPVAEAKPKTAPAGTKVKGAKPEVAATSPSKKDKVEKKGSAKVVETKPVKPASKESKSKPAPSAKAKPEKPAKAPTKAEEKTSKKGAKPDAKAPKAPATAVERYSIQSKESMDASRAAAARFAKAAGLQPVQSNVNGDLDETPAPRLTKSPLSKKQIAHFREVLLLKRRQLVGDVTSMETEALTGGSGSLSHLPQHMADQGSDTYDQTLALDLAASQRGMLKEIDDALARIDAGTYGICDMLGVAISPERLEETPWARYSIDAARRLERGAYAR